MLPHPHRGELVGRVIWRNPVCVWWSPIAPARSVKVLCDILWRNTFTGVTSREDECFGTTQPRESMSRFTRARSRGGTIQADGGILLFMAKGVDTEAW
jgi:hypothetical protein